jgi:CHASE2 domain-containing sensor protein
MVCDQSLWNEARHVISHFFYRVGEQLSHKSLIHWTTVIVLIAVGGVIGSYLKEWNYWIDWRCRVYQFVNDNTTPHPPRPKRTAVVLIGNEEYWNGPLAGRVPLKRNYLADLLLKLDAANPEVIALDVDLSSRLSDTYSGEYATETKQLLEAINTVSHNRSVILGEGIKPTSTGEKRYEPVSTIYDGYDFGTGRVGRGYISLPYDIRRIALAQRARDESQIDSFASAIVRSVDDKAIIDAQDSEHSDLPYGTFIDPEKFPTRSAAYVLNADTETLKKEFEFKIVLIGGAWQKLGFELGPKNDGHFSPLGEIYGVFIHANYIEALLDSRIYKPMGEIWGTSIEIAFSFILALFLSLQVKLYQKVIFAAVLCVVMIVISYFTLQNLGIFFDFFIPIFLLAGHVLAVRIQGE